MLMGDGEAKLGYQTHYVVDGGEDRIILAAFVTPSEEVRENRPMLDLLWRSYFRWQIWPHHVIGNRKYGRERRGCGASERPGVHGAAPERGQPPHLWQGGFYLRPERGWLCLPGQRAFAAPGQEGKRRRARGEGHHLPGQGLILQDVPTEIKMYLQQARTQSQAGSLRGISRSRAQLRWNALVREGTEKAQGMDRIAGLARPKSGTG